MKKLYTLIISLSVGVGATAQSYLPLKDFQDQSVTSGGWITRVVHDPSATHDWNAQDNGSPGDFYGIATGWNGASADTTVMWLISPAMNLTTATMPELRFENATNFTGPALEVVVSSDYDGTSDPTAQGTWDTITSQATMSGGGFSWVTSGAVDLSAYNGQSSVYVGFAYASGPAVGAASWEVDSIDVRESTGPPSLVTIHEIQFSAPPYNSPYDGQTVITTGIVTAVDTGSTGFWMQDTMASPWNGLYIYNPGGPDPLIGDSVVVEGDIVEFNDLTEMNNVVTMNVISSGHNVWPDTVTTLGANDEMHESCFIRAEAATVTNDNAGFGQFEIDDSSGPVLVDDRMYDHFAMLNDVYNVQGVMFYAFSERKILPRMASDVEDITSVGEPGYNVNNVYPNPVKDVLVVELSEVPNGARLDVVDATGKLVHSTNVNQLRNEVDFSGLADGLYHISITTEKGMQAFTVVK